MVDLLKVDSLDLSSTSLYTLPPKTSPIMKRAIFLSLIFALALNSEKLSAQQRYYKGNTHIHMYGWSGDIKDSTYTPEVVVADYIARGYDFLVFTNHGNWFDASSYSTPTLTIISGEEAGISGKGRWGHFSAVGINAQVVGKGLTHQQLIDSIIAAGGIPFLNHPRFNLIPLNATHVIDSMKSGLHHMEVWNGTTVSQPPPDDMSVWDSVLSTGRLMYGIACDDSHKKSHQGKAWIMVYAASNKEEDLLKAIREGGYYATNGAMIDSIARSSSGIYVRSSDADRIRFIGKNGIELTSFAGKEASYAFKGNETYVRAEVVNAQGQRAWTQPVMVKR